MEPAKETIRELFKLASEYLELRMVKKRYLSLLYVLNHNGNEYYCFAREKSDSYSFNVCIGETALFSSLKSFAPFKKPPVDSMFEIDAISVGFTKENSYPERDLEILKDIGIKYNSKFPIPYFRRFTPGIQPWRIDDSESAILIYALKWAIKLLGGEVPDIEQIKQGKIPYIVDNENGEFETKYKALTLKSTDYSIFTPDDASVIDEITSKCKRKGRLCAGIYRSPVPGGFDEKGRALFPKIYILIDYKNDILISINDFEDITKDGYKIIEDMVNYIFQTAEIPRTLLVRNEETLYLMKDVCELLGIKIKLQTDIKMLDSRWLKLSECNSAEDVEEAKN